MRFAHIADCHLGSWRQQELQELNLACFKKALETCIKEEVEFILFSGDLFDSAYPPIEILKETFSEFRKLKEARIKSYIIAGSHDYSVSGKTFLDVLERAGFCEMCSFEEQEDGILLKACNHASTSIYGYPGKKSGLEVRDLKKVKIEPSNKFKILMLHTTMESARGTLPIDAIDIKELPQVDYYALGHLHLIHKYTIENDKYLVYPGPIFPNNFQELEELGCGSFFIIDVNGYVKLTKKELKLKEVVSINLEIENALTATEKILAEIESQNVEDKIVLLRLKGILQQGKTSDIKFQTIQEKIREKKAYSFLKNTNKLKVKETEIEIKTDNLDKIEDTITESFIEQNPSDFNSFIPNLVNSFNLEKQEDEKRLIFESRLLSEINKILKLEIK